MRITFDSSEPLDDVLRVVSSAYGVTVTVHDEPGTSSEAGRPRRAARARTTDRRGRRSRPSAKAQADPKLIRQWAWENGHDVNARGSLPAAVRAAYAAANPA